jgi:hypothetical protein
LIKLEKGFFGVVEKMSWVDIVLWPGASLPLYVPRKIRDFLKMAMQSEVGNGASTLFWSDRWLGGQRTVDIAPRLLEIIPKKLINKRTV